LKQAEFANSERCVLEPDDKVIGLAAAGSWLTNEIDEFSDLDLILVTQQKVSGDKNLMLDYEKKWLVSYSPLQVSLSENHEFYFCLSGIPLLREDIKFVTLDKFHLRIEIPIILIHVIRKSIHVICKTFIINRKSSVKNAEILDLKTDIF
jgi:hypothetical protein